VPGWARGVVALPLAALAVLAAGCSGAPEPAPTSDLDAAEEAACADLAEALPSTLAGEQLESTEDRVTTWGPISLTCGVAEPTSLEPTSECDEVLGIGWYVEPAAMAEPELDAEVTAIGVRPRVTLVLPGELRGQPSLEALSALAEPIEQSLRVVQPCQ
jgi:hypothetical protein